MVQMLGENRVFDSLIFESDDSVSTERIINLYGIKDIDELQDKPLLVKSGSDGEAGATTIKIVTEVANPDYPDESDEPRIIEEIDEIDLYVFDNQGVSEPFENWVVSGQPYFLVYDGASFTAYPISNNKDSGGGGGPTIPAFLSLPYAVYNLTNAATATDIKRAFGGGVPQGATSEEIAEIEEQGEELEIRLQSWIEGAIGFVRFIDESNGLSVSVNKYSFSSGTKNKYILNLSYIDLNIVTEGVTMVNKSIVLEKQPEPVGQETLNLFDKVTIYDDSFIDGSEVSY